ncbi:MAG: NADH:flavin oxidoreductase [Dehalococcoidia bacterium]|nr:NADH:flavin oxidoreductase [Dehalococcoidia bacterium]
MKLLEPIQMGGVQLKNRVVMPAMFVNLGLRSRRARAFYVERARGGVAAIIMVGTSVDLFFSDAAWGKPGGVAGFIDGLKQLTSDVQQAGSKIGIQLFHTSRFPSGTGLEDTRGDAVAPSAMDDIRYKGGKSGLPPYVPCRELTTTEVETIIGRFGAAARGVKEAGFDFLEMNAAHGHFASQFFSPLDNRRTDRFGGDIRDRMTFGLECVKTMRAATSPGFPIIYRIGGQDEVPGGVTLSDNVAFAVELQKAGVDAFNISVGSPDDPRRYFAGFLTPTSDRPEALLADWAAAFKQKVTAPVIVVGRIHAPEVAEQIISQGKTDLVAVGRQLLSDPHWTAKIASGKHDEIVRCLSCNTCMASVAAGDIRCSVNPILGKETEYIVAPTAKPKRVLVIGGGAAGMEAATVAALRGHDVTLWEKENSLGGQLKAASVPPHKKEIGMLNPTLQVLAQRAGDKS